jgi:hypothetical protein
MEAAMLEIRAYYHDVLRYTTVGDWDKVHELRNDGFNVQVKETSGRESGLSGLRSTLPTAINGNGDAIARHENELGAKETAEEGSDARQNTLGFVFGP